MTTPKPLLSALVLGLSLLAGAAPAQAQTRGTARSADYIVAVVNNELVTQFEVEQRLAQAREQAQRSGQSLPPDAELRRQAVQSLIDERVVITWARDSGLKVDDQEVERAVANVAASNKLSVEQLKARLRDEAIDYGRFRNNLRDQILAERVREREVPQRIRISDAEVEDAIDAERAKAGAGQVLNIAQILVTVPEGAAADVLAQRRARAESALARVKGGEPFEKVARELSEDANRERGGEIGSRPVDRLPDLFVNAVRTLPVGGVSAELVRSGAGFHILKVIERMDKAATVTQTRARHILLRPSARQGVDAATRRLADLRAQIVGGQRRFEDVAREVSEDGSAAGGGDLGWATPGMFVPEFEDALNRLTPGAVSPPVESRFGVHLIQVVERRQVAMEPRQLREQARAALRESRYPAAYDEWLADLRSRAYIEMREAPQ